MRWRVLNDGSGSGGNPHLSGFIPVRLFLLAGFDDQLLSNVAALVDRIPRLSR